MIASDHRARTRDSYDTVAADYATLLPGLDAETALDIAMLDDFAARCVKTQLGPVADVGCGSGRLSGHLAARGTDVFGIDFSPGMISIARQAYPHLRFDVGEMENLHIPDASLGGLLAWYSLIHTSPALLPAAITEFSRALTPGAYLLTAFQIGEGQRVDLSNAYGHTVALTNYRHDPQHMTAVLKDKGFDVQANLQRSPEGTEKTPQAILLACRRR